MKMARPLAREGDLAVEEVLEAITMQVQDLEVGILEEVSRYALGRVSGFARGETEI